MKIIASDYDGTINYKGKISEEDQRAIAKFRKAGNKFGIVTGRDLELVLWIIHDTEKIGLEIDFVICCTGAIILNGKGEVVKIKSQRTDTFLDEMVKKAQEMKLGTFYVSSALNRHYVDRKNNIPYNFSSIKEFTQVNAWFLDDSDAEAFTEYVVKNHSDKISAYRNGGSVDMPPKSTSKVTGIYDYAEQFDAPEIYAVGDNENDIPMIKEFCGFAVSNAVQKVKEIANYQCDRIADMIEMIMEEG